MIRRIETGNSGYMQQIIYALLTSIHDKKDWNNVTVPATESTTGVPNVLLTSIHDKKDWNISMVEQKCENSVTY